MFPTLTRDDVFRVETPRLWLRWPRLEDSARLLPWMCRPEVATMTSTFQVGMTGAEFEARLERMLAANEAGRGLQFVIVPKGADHVPIGMVGTTVQPGGRIELGYQLDPQHWGSGLMTEAVGALCAQVFDLTSVANIGASVRPDNAASIRVLEHCGFKVTGSGEHDSPVYGRYAVHTYALKRLRPSPLLAAKHRHSSRRSAQHALVGLV